MQQTVKNSLELWRAGDEGKLDLWNRAPRFTKNGKVKNDEISKIKQAIALTREGEVSKGLRALIAWGLAPTCQDTLEKLMSKHPFPTKRLKMNMNSTVLLSQRLAMTRYLKP